MKCLVCSKELHEIEELIEHESTETHQENVRKHHNMLLDYFEKEDPVISEAIPGASELVLIAPEIIPDDSESVTITLEPTPDPSESAVVAPETVLVAPETVLVAPETVLVAPETTPHASELAAVASETTPCAFESVTVTPETTPDPSESVLVTPETTLDAPESVPAGPESVPAGPESVPAGPESVPVGPAPVASETVPNAADPVSVDFSSKLYNTNLFSCTPCSMGFSNLSNAIQHLRSLLHLCMVLATGIGFDERFVEGDNFLPVLFYCIICDFRCFDLQLYHRHLKTNTHGRTVQRLSNFFEEKSVNNTDNVGSNELISKNSSKNPPQYYCKLCNIEFKNTKCFRNHVNGKKHQRILSLMKKIAHRRKENLTHCSSLKAFGNLNTSQYYCELCNILIDSNDYESHLEWDTHKRIDQFINTMPFKSVSDSDIFGDSDDFKKFDKDRCLLYHCMLCFSWCIGYKCYEDHVNGKRHRRNAGQKSVGADPKPPDDINNSSQSSRYCEICDIRFFGPCYENHLNGKTHSRKMGQKRIGADPESPDNMNYSFLSSCLCEVCNLQCVTSECFKKHLKTKIHTDVAGTVNEPSEMEGKGTNNGSYFEASGDSDMSLLPYYCNLCGILWSEKNAG